MTFLIMQKYVDVETCTKKKKIFLITKFQIDIFYFSEQFKNYKGHLVMLYWNCDISICNL